MLCVHVRLRLRLRVSGNETLLNKDTIDAFLGVAMMGTAPSWTANPLNMVNFYGFGRLAWDTSLSADDIYEEWIQRTFGAAAGTVVHTQLHGMLNMSENTATNLGIYHGYRGVWYVWSILLPGMSRMRHDLHGARVVSLNCTPVLCTLGCNNEVFAQCVHPAPPLRGLGFACNYDVNPSSLFQGTRFRRMVRFGRPTVCTSW